MLAFLLNPYSLLPDLYHIKLTNLDLFNIGLIFCDRELDLELC
jgi:hypothetical protein